MISYIKEENAPMSRGVQLVTIFFTAQLIAQIFRNRYILGGFETSIKLRRTLVAALYDKVVNLSMKSMTETNSGKLISLISADLFSVEKGLSFFPILLAGPIINFFAYIFLAKQVGIIYTFVTFGFWLFLMCLQYLSSSLSKKLKATESGINDERLKLVNDLVVGCRTIKCYGWENHYIERIYQLRKQQMKSVMKFNIVQSFGTSFF